MKVKFIVAFLASVAAFSSQSASLGTYRIYLDEDNPKQKFSVRNKSNVPEICRISFKNRRFDGDGGLVKLSEEQQELYSAPALSRFRFSPKTFTIAPNTTQHVAFSYRRKPGDSSSELRTYPSVLCEKANKRELKDGNFGAVLELSVPLVIRTGKVNNLQADLDFSIVEKNEQVTTVKLEHKGNRSVYGDINIVNKDGDVIQLVRKNAVVYPDMKVLSVNIRSEIANMSDVYLEFKEKDNFSSAKTFRWEI